MTSPATTAREEIDPLSWILAALVSGLVLIRWWQPTEGTVQGDTLGIVLGWPVALALYGWIGVRGTRWKIRLDALQYSVWLLILGHVVSGCLVLTTSGDRRAALNLVWEWLGLGIAFPLIRTVLDSKTARRQWGVICLSGVVSLSVYSLVQQIFVFPRTVAEYRKVRDELDQVEQSAAQTPGGMTYQTHSRIQSLQSKLLKQGLQPQMLSGSSRAMFEDRLLHSSEVLGRFALANTFAGLLLTWEVVIVLQIFTQLRSSLSAPETLNVANAPSTVVRSDGATTSTSLKQFAWSRISKQITLILVAGLIGYVLLLTKSRTAFLATLVALGFWLLELGSRSRSSVQRLLRWTGALVTVIVGLVLIAGITGGLDQLVIKEAPKSLQYRLEYWWGSLRAISDAPLLGIGPGQFRQHYLAYKLPRSSEEIADPHNLFLDVWANGGLAAFAGMVWLICILFGTTFVTGRTQQPAGPTKPQNEGESGASVATSDRKSEFTRSVNTPGVINLSTTVRESGTPAISQQLKGSQPTGTRTKVTANSTRVLATVPVSYPAGWTNPLQIGALGAVLVLWLIGGGLESTLLVSLLVWAVSLIVLDQALPTASCDVLTWKAAGFGLLVHLLGAGGIAMPAINQLLLVIAILCTPSASEDRLSASGESSVEPAGKGIARELTLNKWSSACVIVGALVLFGLCFTSGAQPVWFSSIAIDQGDVSPSPIKREQFYRQATVADPLAPQPWEKLAGLSIEKWRNSQVPAQSDFDAAVASQQEAIKRNPLGHNGYRALGEYYSAQLRLNDSPETRRLVIESFQTALTRYPHHAELLASAAEGFHLAGEAWLALATARRALEQDDLNRTAQHSDKYLSPSLRERVEKIVLLRSSSKP